MRVEDEKEAANMDNQGPFHNTMCNIRSKLNVQSECHLTLSRSIDTNEQTSSSRAKPRPPTSYSSSSSSSFTSSSLSSSHTTRTVVSSSFAHFPLRLLWASEEITTPALVNASSSYSYPNPSSVSEGQTTHVVDRSNVHAHMIDERKEPSRSAMVKRRKDIIGILWVYVLQYGGGTLGVDRLYLRIRLNPCAAAVITTQAPGRGKPLYENYYYFLFLSSQRIY